MGEFGEVDILKWLTHWPTYLTDLVDKGNKDAFSDWAHSPDVRIKSELIDSEKDGKCTI